MQADSLPFTLHFTLCFLFFFHQWWWWELHLVNQYCGLHSSHRWSLSHDIGWVRGLLHHAALQVGSVSLTKHWRELYHP